MTTVRLQPSFTVEKIHNNYHHQVVVFPHINYLDYSVGIRFYLKNGTKKIPVWHHHIQYQSVENPLYLHVRVGRRNIAEYDILKIRHSRRGFSSDPEF